MMQLRSCEKKTGFKMAQNKSSRYGHVKMTSRVVQKAEMVMVPKALKISLLTLSLKLTRLLVRWCWGG